MDIRATTQADIPSVDALLSASYPILLKPDYLASVLVTALPLISKAQPQLVACGTYYGVFEGHDLLAAGGWTKAAPGGGPARAGQGHIRHIVTDHRHVRKGLGRALMAHIFEAALAAGVREMACQSTLTAAPFYRSVGFVARGRIDVPLRAGITFPAIAMVREM